MGKIKVPERVIPFAGLLLSDICLLDEGKKSLESLFGPIDLQSRIIPFTHTNYYTPEMGEHIFRLWVSFCEMSDPEHLPDWKIESNHLEEIWAGEIIQPSSRGDGGSERLQAERSGREEGEQREQREEKEGKEEKREKEQKGEKEEKEEKEIKAKKLKKAEKDAGRLLRRINIDPGYVSESKIVLASTKDFSHRICLRSGIYAEVTLNYRRDRGWQFFDWTYPDYKEKTALDFFTLVRNKLLSAKRSRV